MKRLARGAIFGLLSAASCAHMGPFERQKLADGGYRVDCKDALTRCLTAIEQVCDRGYEVVSANEYRRFMGPREINEPYITSQVVARCRSLSSSLSDDDKPGQPIIPAGSSAADAPASPATPVPSAPPTRCFPGATQACVGAGGCRGGQVCLDDGAAFGSCDCGTAQGAAP